MLRWPSKLEALRSQRKTRPAEPSQIPRYNVISDEVNTLWWHELFPIAAIAKRLGCSAVTVEAAQQGWYENRGLSIPTVQDWCRAVERRILAAFDDDDVRMQEIAERLDRAHGKAMHTVIRVYARLGKELPEAWPRQFQMHATQARNPDTAT